MKSAASAGSGYAHRIIGTVASAHDIEETAKPVCEDDEVVLETLDTVRRRNGKKSERKDGFDTYYMFKNN